MDMAGAWVHPMGPGPDLSLISFVASKRLSVHRWIGPVQPRAGSFIVSAKPKKNNALGPGLFDPTIQLGPEDKWKRVERGPDAHSEGLLSRSQFADLFSQAIDTTSSGLIDATDLISFAASLGQKLTLGQSIAIMRVVDSDRNGLISEDELFSWYSNGGFSSLPTPATEHRLSRPEVLKPRPSAALLSLLFPAPLDCLPSCERWGG